MRPMFYSRNTCCAGAHVTETMPAIIFMTLENIRLSKNKTKQKTDSVVIFKFLKSNYVKEETCAL